MNKTTNELKLKTWKVKEVHEASEIASMSDCLNGDVTYWLGRLADWSQSVVRTYDRTVQKTHVDYQRTKEVWSKMSADEQTKHNNEYQTKLYDLQEQVNIIQFPGFEFGDFLAKDDKISYLRDQAGSIVQKTIKKGEPLLPQRFFNLMGDLITHEDSHLMAVKDLENEPEEAGEKPLKTKAKRTH